MSEEAARIAGEYAASGAKLRERFFRESAASLVEIARTLAVSLAEGGKLLLCGNGGSAADCQHLAAEFVNRFQLERPPLPAVALTTDTSILTAIGNDYGFEQVFAKQVQALGRPGDVLLAISTSGRSPDVVQAARTASERGLIVVGLTGESGGDMEAYCRHLLRVPSRETPLIQEVHIAAGHMLCRLVDYFLFEAVMELQPYLNQKQ